MVVSLVDNLVSTPKIGFWPRNWSSWCVLQRSFGLNLPVEDFTRFYKTYVLAVDQTWCDLDIFGWIRSAWCWFDLISHPPNFIFAAFNMFGEFYIFDFFFFESFFIFGISSKTDEWILENLEFWKSFTFERKCLLLKINKQTWGNLEFKSQGITKMDDSFKQFACPLLIVLLSTSIWSNPLSSDYSWVHESKSNNWSIGATRLEIKVTDRSDDLNLIPQTDHSRQIISSHFVTKSSCHQLILSSIHLIEIFILENSKILWRNQFQ